MFVEKTYTIAGTSYFQGTVTYRFATGSAGDRTKVLTRCGHSDVEFFTLPRPMVLKDALAYLKRQGVTAVLPQGQRRGLNGRQEGYVVVERAAVQHDAHVETHGAWLAAEADRKAAFVARMRAAREAKRAVRETEAA